MNAQPDLAELLDRSMTALNVGEARLANLVNHVFDRPHFLHRSTVRNWRTGTSKKVKDWRQLVAIAAVLGLERSQLNQLLHAANLPALQALRQEADEENNRLLARWPPKLMPLQMPPRQRHFIGRRAELLHLLTELHPGCLLTLCGPGGMGKTTLAAEAIHRLVEQNELSARFPDGVIWHSFYNQPDVKVALEKVVRSLGEEPRPTPAAAAQRLLASRQLLLLLDGTEAADNLTAILDVRGQCGILITTRLRQDAPAARRELVPLQTGEAVSLLQAWGGKRAADQRISEKICRLLGNLPLAVQLVGRYLDYQAEEAADYLHWLEQTPLTALDFGQRQRESVPIFLGQSLKKVSPLAQQTMATIGMLALASFTRDAIASALNLSTVAIGRPLGELVNYGLLQRQRQHYQVTHALVHTYAQRRLTPPEAAIERLADHFTHFAREHHQRGTLGYDGLDHARPHILSLLGQLKQQERWEAVQHLPWAIEEYLGMRGYGTDRITVIKIGLEAIRRQADPFRLGAALINLGLAYAGHSQTGKAVALYQEALARSRQHGLPRIEEAALGNLGNAQRMLGNMIEAIGYYEQALVISRQIENPYGEGLALGNLGVTHLRLGDIDQAHDLIDSALRISREIEDRRHEATWLGNLGDVFRHLGKYDQALAHCQQALEISRELSDRHQEANWLGGFGQVHAAMGKAEQAIVYYRRALDLSRQFGDRHQEAAWLGCLGTAYHSLQDPDRAISFLQEAVALSQKIDDLDQQGEWLTALGQTYWQGGQRQKAVASLSQAAAAYRAARSPKEAAVQQTLAQWIR